MLSPMPRTALHPPSPRRPRPAGAPPSRGLLAPHRAAALAPVLATVLVTATLCPPVVAAPPPAPAPLPAVAPSEPVTPLERRRAAAAERRARVGDDAAVRQVFLDYHARLRLEHPAMTDVERLGCLLQRVVDANHAWLADAPVSEAAVKGLVLDDLVDLLVDRHAKARLMATEPRVRLHKTVRDGDLSGFREDLRRGDGRLRHFAASASAAELDGSPFDLLSRIGARVAGGDWPWSRDAEDAAADVGTNAVGRGFYGELLGPVALGELVEGELVGGWVVERLGEPGTVVASGCPVL